MLDFHRVRAYMPLKFGTAWKRDGMKAPLKVLTFGVASGLVWSAVPGFLLGFYSHGAEMAVADIVAAVLAGVLTSFALRLLLAKTGNAASILFGAVSLPLGAFLFGAIFSIVHPVFSSGDLASNGVTRASLAVATGRDYAVGSTCSNFAIWLFPAAVLTTFLLRRVVLSVKAVEECV
jgi:hypothetical protein